jgi:acyl-CoA thioesterase-1
MMGVMKLLWNAMRVVTLTAALVLAPMSAQAAGTNKGTILVYGDSLSAAYGIAQKDGWVTLLQERLQKSGGDYSVANASISGETSSGGASRIQATLVQHKPRITIVELGANDGLRGLPVKQMAANLDTIVNAAQKAGSKVVLVGMRIPPNYGREYTRDFEKAFADLSKRRKLPLVPFLFEGMADRAELFQQDQLHPTAAAQPQLLENVWKALKPLL